MKTYRYWAWLHTELVPYFYSYAYRMYETPDRRLLRRGPMTYSLRVGNELYAPIVTEPTQTMDVRLPFGQWIDYWDESRLVSGMVRDFPVPLGREPIFIRSGSFIPMDVRNAQTGHGTTAVERLADRPRLPERHLLVPLPRGRPPSLDHVHLDAHRHAADAHRRPRPARAPRPLPDRTVGGGAGVGRHRRGQRDGEPGRQRFPASPPRPP